MGNSKFRKEKEKENEKEEFIIQRIREYFINNKGIDLVLHSFHDLTIGQFKKIISENIFVPEYR